MGSCPWFFLNQDSSLFIDEINILIFNLPDVLYFWQRGGSYEE